MAIVFKMFHRPVICLFIYLLHSLYAQNTSKKQGDRLPDSTNPQINDKLIEFSSVMIEDSIRQHYLETVLYASVDVKKRLGLEQMK